MRLPIARRIAAAWSTGSVRAERATGSTVASRRGGLFDVGRARSDAPVVPRRERVEVDAELRGAPARVGRRGRRAPSEDGRRRRPVAGAGGCRNGAPAAARRCFGVR